MKITYEDDYALKTIFDLALHYGVNMHISDIARRQDIPAKFLEQVLLKLKRSGFVVSKKGPNGGYRLVKEPKDISLKEVLESISGPYAPIECAWNPGYSEKCRYFHDCVFQGIFSDIYRDVSKKLEDMDFQKVIDIYKKKTKRKFQHEK
ncbi:MAG: Rrf2 family transcriptional regulator [Candidatus Aureabacteria bacterium]|nr:Rrf2 family transcriptional regulator [Candidatus Auribacterota bacterium]